MALPDLMITDTPSLSTASPAEPGGWIMVFYTVHNGWAGEGYGDAGASVSGVYLSTDSTISAGDIFLGTADVGALPGGKQHLGADQAVVRLPDTLAPGTYYIGVIADYRNTMNEASESNNTSPAVVITVTSQPALPDLDVLMAPTISNSRVAQGASITLSYDLWNVSTFASGTSVTGIYLSADSTITAADRLLTTDAVTALQSHGMSGERVTVTLPDDVAPGTYYLGVMADHANAIAERSEANNSSDGVYIEVREALPPDLKVASVSAVSGTSLGAGGSLSLLYQVQNAGDKQAAATVSGIYLSSDATISDSDTLLGTDSVAALAGGGSSYETATVTLPGNLAPGTYYVGVIADKAGFVGESNEANNGSSPLAIEVKAPAADLVIRLAPRLASANAEIGMPFSLTYTVSNAGQVAASATASGIYLSSDSVITADDRLLATDAVVALAAGASSTETVDLTLPGNIGAGGYYIGVLADSGKAVSELSENNNVSASSYVQIRPEVALADIALKPGGLHLSASEVSLGNDVYLDYRVLNLSHTPTGAFNTGIYLSRDSVITRDDTMITVDPVSAMGALGASTEHVRLSLSSYAPGTWYIGAIADPNGRITEKSEANNVSEGIAITVLADLSLTAGADTLTLGPTGRIVHGLGGNDTIKGGLGADTIYGDAGDDSISGGGARTSSMGATGMTLSPTVGSPLRGWKAMPATTASLGATTRTRSMVAPATIH